VARQSHGGFGGGGTAFYTQGGRFREIVAFHCQQAVEKYLKALLVQRQVEFPKTHDIAKLLDRVATVDLATAKSLRDADALTPFGVEARYPSDAPEVLPSGEVEAIGMARVVRTAVMILLQPYLDAR
jgi:HEPN domain-containing protein